MKIDENGMCTLSEEDCSYHSCNTKKNICSCYHPEINFLGKIGVCWGTKECEACSCGGDDSKCDFYEDKRKKATPNNTNAYSIKENTYWISVTERLPEDRHNVLVYAGVIFPYITIGYYDDLWKFSFNDNEIAGGAKYWMPLPNLPKGSWLPLPEPPKED